MTSAGRDPGNWNVDVAADQGCEQRHERKLGRQSNHLECVGDDVDFDQDEKEGERKKEKYRVEGEEGREEHRAIIASSRSRW